MLYAIPQKLSAAEATNVIVLCSSCSLPGLPPGGDLMLLDSTNGDLWMYSDAALAGQAKPILYGKFILGQPVVRSTSLK